MLLLSQRIWLFVSILFSLTSVLPALAEIREFSQLTMILGFNTSTGIVTGNTGGSYSLSSIANTDINGNVCIGYGDPEPDHKMVLEKDFSHLKLQLNSHGSNTTLVVKGPDRNTIRCNFGDNDIEDAAIEDKNWKAGTYQIWVGSLENDRRTSYVLSVDN
jgi:hypothetical protein